MVGIQDIARETGVSMSTVSNVLNGKENVGIKTREKVLNACVELGYNIKNNQKVIKEIDSKTILLLFGDFDRSFHMRVMEGIHDYLKENEYGLLVCTDKLSQKFMNKNYSNGAIVLDMRVKDAIILEAANKKYPIVTLDRILSNEYIKSVLVNNYDVMKILVQELIDRGYRKFGFIGGVESTLDNEERYGAFIEVLEKNKIPFQQKAYHAGNYKEKSGYTAAKILLLSNELPEVLVCANDNMAIGAIKAFRESGIRVPEDIAVTGFDDSGLAETYGLTTIGISNYERGYIAARFLMENIRGVLDNEVFKISAKIIWRDTVLLKRRRF